MKCATPAPSIEQPRPLSALGAAEAALSALESLKPAHLSRLVGGSPLLTESRAEIVKKRLGSRSVVLFRLVIPEPATASRRAVELIGKRHSETARAAEEFRAMRKLWAAGFTRQHGFRIPQPLHFFRELSLILQTKAPGDCVRSIITGGISCETGLRLAARWAAALHSLRGSSEMVDYGRDLRSAALFSRALEECAPAYASRVRSLAGSVRQRLLEFPSVPATMVHGDYHPENVFVAGDTITVIDFDRFGYSDPARDVGSFIAQLRAAAWFAGLPLAAADANVRVFLREYLSVARHAAMARITRRIAAYVSLVSLEILYYTLCVLKAQDPRLLPVWLAQPAVMRHPGPPAEPRRKLLIDLNRRMYGIATDH